MIDQHFEKAESSLTRSRSRFPFDFDVKTSFAIGDLEPWRVIEILPGDTVNLQDLTFVARSQTPVVPAMDNAFIDFYAFFVPNQLVWNFWKNFAGEPSQIAFSSPISDLYTPAAFLVGAGFDSDSVSINPFVEGYISDDSDSGFFTWRSVGAQMGLPYGSYIDRHDDSNSINALPLLAYIDIYDNWFRDSVNVPPIQLVEGDFANMPTSQEYVYASPLCFPSDLLNGEFNQSSKAITLVGPSNELGYAMPCFAVSKFHDYFTSSLPSPQRGDVASIIDGGLLPLAVGSVYQISNTSSSTGAYLGRSGQTGVLNNTSSSSTGGTQVSAPSSLSYSSGGVVNQTNIYAKQVSLDISQFRKNVAIQHFQELAASANRYYNSILQVYFGTSPSPDRLERPEYLWGKRIPLSQTQVTSTNGASGANLGATGAYGYTASKQDGFTKTFTEHGYVIMLACIRYEHTYSDGIDQTFLRRHVLDYYWPPFANVGEQPVSRYEIYYGTDSDGYVLGMPGSSFPNDSVVFGYQEYGAYYRYQKNETKAAMRPALNSGFQVYTYADAYSDAPSFNAGFTRENPEFMRRNFQLIDTNGIDFIIDIHCRGSMTRCMPTYSVPGLDKI